MVAKENITNKLVMQPQSYLIIYCSNVAIGVAAVTEAKPHLAKVAPAEYLNRPTLIWDAEIVGYTWPVEPLQELADGV